MNGRKIAANGIFLQITSQFDAEGVKVRLDVSVVTPFRGNADAATYSPNLDC